MVSKHTNASGQVRYFTALYPDGGTATFGFTTNWYPQSTYPISLLTDKDGNTIHFYYTQTGNYYYINYITYGNGARIDFTYSSRSDVAPYQYSSYGQSHPFPQKLLSGITSRDGSETICEYLLSQEYSDGVSLLSEVRCLSGGEELPPLGFEYGIDTELGYTGDPAFVRIDSLLFLKYFVKSENLSLQYHRGKLIPGHLNDGVVILPQKSTYARIDSTWVMGWKFQYGSKYSASQEFLCNFTAYDPSGQKTILAEYGFQLIEAVDVDGDGTDELVKINFGSPSRDVTTYTITVYSFDRSYNISSRSFSVNVNDGWHNLIYFNPAKSYYRFGNFKGDGKTMLLIMTKNSSKFALVDLNTGTKLSETTLFTTGDEVDNLVIAADFENDGKTDLCQITDSGMNVYSLSDTSSTSFSLRTTYSGVTKDLLYRDTAFGQSGAASKAKLFTVDINADGYLDIASAPDEHSDVPGLIHHPSRWNFARFNGQQFSVDTTFVKERKPEDSIVFLDVDKDGLPDILHIQDSLLYYCPNVNGWFSEYHNYAGVTVNSSSDLIPGDLSLFGIYGDIIVNSGPEMKAYRFSLDHASRRNLSQLTDSFGNLNINMYARTGEYGGAYLIDPNRTFSSSSGFLRLRAPIRVLLSEYHYDASYHNCNYKNYLYWDAVYHSRGLGFCGFGKIQTWDSTTGNWTTSVMNPESFGVVTSVLTSKIYNGQPFNTLTNTYDSHSTTYGKLNPRLTQSVAVDSLTGITTTTSYAYGDYDLPTQVITSRQLGTESGHTDKATYSYQHSISSSKYIIGALSEELHLINTDSNPDSTYRRKTLITYDELFHPVITKQYVGYWGFPAPIPYDSLQLRITPVIHREHLVSTTRRTYDSRGYITSEKTAPYGATEFIGDTLVYDSNGRYLLSKADALGRTTTYSGYNKFGKPTSVTDYHSHTTTYTYDSWGNLVGASHPDGGTEQTTAAWGGDGLYTVTHTETGSPETVTHYDALGREVKSGVKRFDGQWQWTKREYDARGRLNRVSLPYRGSSPAYWNTYYYDDYDRPDSLVEASGRVTRWSYSGTSTTTVKDGVSTTVTADASGRTISVSDAGGTVTYNLRDDGQPSSVVAPGNIVTTFIYDDYGRRTQMVDPSLGTETDSFVWNSDGSSSTTHTNRNGTVTTAKDKYGRVTSVSRAGELNTTYSYDTYGRLTYVSSTNYTSKQYTYDAYDRIATLKETVPDGKWLQKSYSYSAGSVLSSIAYTSQFGYITTEHYSYANSHNTGITLPDSTVVWSLVSENDLGQPTEITTGGLNRQYGFTPFGLPTYRMMMDDGYIQDVSYQFDPLTGNLLSRFDETFLRMESFTYDNLNRLTGITQGGVTRQIVYSDNGNINSIGGVGTLIYGGGEGVSPYEVTGLTPEAGQPAYRQRSVTYNSFDRPEAVSENTSSATITYNADGDRVKTLVFDSSSGPVFIRHYAGGRYEFDTIQATERLYLGGDAYSAPMVLQRSLNGGSWTLYNIGRDYLGSITDITDADGTVVAQYRYDPWGRLVNPLSGAPYQAGCEPSLYLGRGFTGHEYLLWFGLINANARLYDPLLGRFLSPDPYVQDPDFSQNYNRYSYCLNNPLRYTDEDGEWLHIVIGAAVGGIGNLIGNWKNCSGFWEYFAAFGVGAAMGAAVAATGGALAAVEGFGAVAGTIGMGMVGGAVNSATGNIIQQTGKNFEGIEDIDGSSLMKASAIGAVAGGVGAGVGMTLPGADFSVTINEEAVKSPLLASFISGSVAGGAAHVAGGTTAGLLSGQSLGNAFQNSLSGFWTSFWTGGAFSAASTAAYSVVNGINPLNGKALDSNNELIDATVFGLKDEVDRIQRGELYPQYKHDGSIFRNDKGYLPSGVEYREYYLPSINGSAPGASRIVVGNNNSWYYTPDHYHTFYLFKP